MFFEPWMLAAMEESGYMDTSQGLVSRVANHIREQYPAGGYIDNREFRDACLSCGVNPDSFTQEDRELLLKKLNH